MTKRHERRELIVNYPHNPFLNQSPSSPSLRAAKPSPVNLGTSFAHYLLNPSVSCRVVGRDRMMCQSISKILLVEDHEVSRDMLTRRLHRRGYSVTCAIDGPSAVAMAASELPDVILMDVGLGEMDGWEATQLIKANPCTAWIPIIVLTGHSLESDRLKSLEVGCADFDTKPVDIERLLGKIKNAERRSTTTPSVLPAAPQRRRVPRQRILKQGTISFGAGGGVSCVVRDHSETGANLEVVSSAGIPRMCVLKIEGQSAMRDCVVVWTRQTRIGVQFI